jgi:hypothetical protein
MPTRDFDAEARDRIAQYALPTFMLAGREFTVRDDVRPDVMAMWDALGPESTLTQTEQLGIMDEVFQALIIPEDGERFREMRADPAGPGLMTLLQAAQWCVEQITARPFQQRPASGGSAGGARPQDSSTVAALRVQVSESGVSASETG